MRSRTLAVVLATIAVLFGQIAASAAAPAGGGTLSRSSHKASQVQARTALPSLDTALAWDSTLKEATVSNGTPAAHFVFNLTNVSPAAVIISNVQTSCECTVAKLPRQPWRLAPGAHGQIEATMTLDANLRVMIRTLTVHSDLGDKLLYVRANVMGPLGAAPNDNYNRERNQRIATANRQAVFEGDCARCHVAPALGEKGRALYVAACGICHDATNRAVMVPSLAGLPQRADVTFWKNWISYGKPGSLMPAFARSEGGILTEARINALADYLASVKPAKSPQNQMSQGSRAEQER